MPRERPARTMVFVAVATIVAGIGAVAIAASNGSEPEARVFGGNLPVNAGAANLADISAHNSPTLVRNPVDTGNLAIANRIDLPLFSCALHLSFDGGASWAQTPLPVPAGEEPKCYAPDVSFGSDGTLYLSFVTLQGVGNLPHAVWLATSDDGGRTLSTPSKVLDQLAFQVRLLADPSVPGRLYLTWLQAQETAGLGFAGDGYPVNFMISEDGGGTWDPPVRVNSPDRRRVVAPSLAVGVQGELYTLFLDVGDDKLDYAGAHAGQGGDPYGGTWSLVLGRSPDSGRTWTETVVDDGVVPSERFVAFLPPVPSLAVDPARSRVFVAYNDGRWGDVDVAVWASHDSGRTWAAPVRVNDTGVEDGTFQYRPKLALAPNGRLDVMYYDRRSDRNNILNQVSLQSSFDGGRTFTGSLRISDVAFNSGFGLGAERGLPDLGSRLALLSTDQAAVGVWSDSRLATEASRKHDLVMSFVRISEPGGLSDRVGTTLRVGGLLFIAAGLALLAWRFRYLARSRRVVST